MGDLYPPGVAQLGVSLERLLIVRARRRVDALWVCEQALRCKAFGAVVLPVRSIDVRASRRLQLAAEAGGGVGLLIRGEARGGSTFAASRLRVDPVEVGSTVGDRRDARQIRDAGVLRMRIEVLKLRDGRASEPFTLELPPPGSREKALFESRGTIAGTVTVSAGAS